MEGPSPAKRLKLMDESAPLDAATQPGPPSSPPPPAPPAASSFPAHFGEHAANGSGTVKIDKIASGHAANGNGSAPDDVDAFISSAMNGDASAKDAIAESDDEEAEEEEVAPDVPAEEDLSHRDMYLDSVARANLDFDFERLCSKSLSNINVYACLVCGKYFQGRGKGSWAYRHAVGENHRVWLNMQTEKVSERRLGDVVR